MPPIQLRIVKSTRRLEKDIIKYQLTLSDGSSEFENFFTHRVDNGKFFNGEIKVNDWIELDGYMHVVDFNM